MRLRINRTTPEEAVYDLVKERVLMRETKANGINGYHRLQALFARLPQAQTEDDYEAQLPWRIELLTA